MRASNMEIRREAVHPMTISRNLDLLFSIRKAFKHITPIIGSIVPFLPETIKGKPRNDK
jgi:hypothetical protein